MDEKVLELTLENLEKVKTLLLPIVGRTVLSLEFHGRRQFQNELFDLKQVLYVAESRELLLITFADEIRYRFPVIPADQMWDNLSETTSIAEVIRERAILEDQSVHPYTILVFTISGKGEPRQIFLLERR